MSRYARSLDLLTRARRVTPTGAQTRSKAAPMFVEGAYPAFLVSGRGARVLDVDGHEYVDWSMGLAAIGLGYCHPTVDEAVMRQVRDGASFSLPHPLESEVAEQLVEIIPCAESVRFVKSGSEATEAAMRIARVVTGRDVVLSIGYHGWHSVHDAAKAEHPGVPQRFAETIYDVAFNDPLDHVTKWDVVAAILVEPALHEPPALGYLQRLRDLCERHGALLIFDEVVTGFRWALGGAQAHFGVTPDLACFGKALANGYPLACVVGRRHVMDRGAPFVSGTFGGEAVSLAAARATIEVYRREPVIERLWATGERFIQTVNDTARAWSGAMPLRASGYPCKPRLEATMLPRETLAGYTGSAEERRLIMSLVLQETAARGVLLHPASLNVSYAHGDREIHDTRVAISAACQAVLEALGDGNLSRALRGRPSTPSFVRSSS